MGARQGVYAATKAGVRALCEVLRQETGPEIRATMICPGATDTEFTSDPELRERIATIAMAPDAVAGAIAYALAQPADVTVAEIVVRSAAQPEPVLQLHPHVPRILLDEPRSASGKTSAIRRSGAEAVAARFAPSAGCTLRPCIAGWSSCPSSR
jgi:hypothetical protein